MVELDREYDGPPAPAAGEGFVIVPVEPTGKIATAIAGFVRGRAIPAPADDNPDAIYFDNGHARELYRAMLAVSSAPAAAVEGWRPIETAPKDGTDIILGSLPQTFRGEPVPGRVTIGHWTSEEECRVYLGNCSGECRCPEYDHVDPTWISWDGGFTPENPATHWMPLPARPADGGR